MTIIVAFVDPSTGEIKQWTSPHNDSTYTEGEYYNSLLALYLPKETDMNSFQETKYYSDGQWYSRVPKPNNFHYWDGSSWLFNNESFFSALRNQRDLLLLQSDWTQLPDAPLTDAQKAEWSTYRQALRDAPINNSSATSLEEVVWPTKPA